MNDRPPDAERDSGRGGAAGLDVLVVGGVGVDHIVRVPALPLPWVDSQVVPPIRTFVGHTGNGVVRGLHALGAATMLADVIGADPEGDLVRASYATAGLAAQFVVHESGTRRSVNLVTGSGDRMALYDPRHPAEFVPDPALWTGGIARARHVHVSIMNWARHALADAVAAGVPTSTDLHDWDGVAEYHRDFAYNADTVFLSAAALRDEGAVVADILDRGRARVVVVMAGARGSRLYLPQAPAPIAVPVVTIPDRPVLDSNGAGDSYVAAFLFARLDGAAPQRAALAGAIGGAYACGSAGTHTSFVDRTRLAELLESVGAPPL